MSSAPTDTRLDCLVREAVANYGNYTTTIAGLGEGRADRVLEINVDPDDLTHAYTRAPFTKCNKIPPGCRIRHFVYMIPVEQRYGREQRMIVGRDGEDLDVAMFFRPSSPASDTVFVAMPTYAFSGPGSKVQYAFRVRNYFERENGVLEPRDDIQIGMELKTTSQSKHPQRGVVLVTNNQLFSFQLGAHGDKQASFNMQYDPLRIASIDSECEESMAELYTQVFGSIVLPPKPEEIMSKAINRHYYIYTQHMSYGGATRGSGATKGGSSLSHASLVAGEEKRWNLSVSNAVAISKRARVQLHLMVGDIAQVFVPNVENSSDAPALPAVLFAPTEVSVYNPYGYEISMHCLETMRLTGVANVQRDKLALLCADMCKWPVDNNDGFEALAVSVREHESRDDEDGEDLSATFFGDRKRVYTVQVGTLLRVRVTNMTLADKTIAVHPFYCQATSACGTCCFWEEEQNHISLVPGDSYELPFPIQKDAREGTDGWILKNGDGMTALTVLFVLPQTLIGERDEVEPNPEEKNMVVDAEGLAGTPTEITQTSAEKLEPECCICLEPKTVQQMAVFVPCGHCVCCNSCYKKQVENDTNTGKRSKCPKCRAIVNSTIKVYF